MSDLAIQLLTLKKESLLAEKEKMNEQFNNDILAIENAIDELSGKTVWNLNTETIYDDTNPDYIKGSIEN